MKKIIKPIIVLLVIAGLVAGGIFAYTKFAPKKAKAEAAPVSNYSMVDSWGNQILSFGEVTSEKAQTAYLDKGTEIVSVNVKEGDHVNEGDVLITVSKESQDIRGKELELQKETQKLNYEKLKMDRLQKEEPIPAYISTSPDTRERTTVTGRTYTLKDDASFMGYSAGQVVYEELGDGGEIVYHDSSNRNASLDPEKDQEAIDSIKSNLSEVDKGALFDCEEHTTTTEVTVGMFHYNAETGELLGRDAYGEDGELIEEFKPPEGLTPEELDEAIEKQMEVLKEQDLTVRVTAHQLDQMRNTAEDGTIKAKVSGTVVKLQDVDNFNNTQPFLTVSATDEYQVVCNIGELDLGRVKVGDSVSLNCWEKGIDAEGTIASMDDKPVEKENDYYYFGNSNVSFYPMVVSVDKSSGLEIGASVSATINPTSSGGDTFYVSKMLVRKDRKGYYVMKLDDKDLTKKVYVKAGKSLYGEYIEIKEGVSQEDYLAFPYGKGAKEGVKCEKIDTFESTLGGGMGVCCY